MRLYLIVELSSSTFGELYVCFVLDVRTSECPNRSIAYFANDRYREA